MLRYLLTLAFAVVSFSLLAQTQGIIKDATNGQFISGASITTNSGEILISDEKGRFVIPDNNSQITVSYVGYETQTIDLEGGEGNLSISLKAGNFNLQEVVVTAYHDNRKLLDTPGPVALISKKEIDRDQDLIITNSLNRVPGVYMHSGTLNTNRITIRGIGSRSRFSTNRVKGYINGIPLTSGDGETTLEDIDLSIVDRVEITKGPSSSEYGAALGGVIHLTTERPDYPKSKINTDTQIGSFGLIRNNSSFDFGFDKGSIKFWASKTVSDGFRENNDYDRETGAIIGQFQISEKTNFSFLFNFIDLKASIPSSIDSATFAENPRAAAANWLAAEGFEDYERGNLGVSFDHQLSDKLMVAYSVFTNFRNANEVRPFDILRENTNTWGVRFKYQYDFQSSKFLPILTLGTEMFSDQLAASTFNNDSIPNVTGPIESQDDLKRNYQNYFLQGDWQLSEKWALIAGLNLNSTKYDFDDLFKADADQSGEVDYDFIASPRVGINYKPNPRVAFHGSISHGFGTPTFEETRDSQGFINPDINPETGYNYEIGSRGTLLDDRLSYDISFYTLRVNDLVVARRITEDQLVGVNAGKTIHNGIEMALGYRFYESQDGFFQSVDGHINYTHADYTFDEFIDEGNDFSGNRLTGTPRNALNGILDVNTSVGLYGNINYRFVDEIPILDDNSVSSDEFQVVNLKGGYQRTVGRITFNLYGGINNLFDERYASQVLINPNFGSRFFYPGQERNFFGGLALSFIL